MWLSINFLGMKRKVLGQRIVHLCINNDGWISWDGMFLLLSLCENESIVLTHWKKNSVIQYFHSASHRWKSESGECWEIEVNNSCSKILLDFFFLLNWAMCDEFHRNYTAKYFLRHECDHGFFLCFSIFYDILWSGNVKSHADSEIV